MLVAVTLLPEAPALLPTTSPIGRDQHCAQQTLPADAHHEPPGLSPENVPPVALPHSPIASLRSVERLPEDEALLQRFFNANPAHFMGKCTNTLHVMIKPPCNGTLINCLAVAEIGPDGHNVETGCHRSGA